MNNEELNAVLRGETATTEPKVEEVVETPTEEVEVQETQESSTPGEASEEQTPEESSPPSYDPSLYDERGVPWKNVAMERERKAQQLVESIPTIIEETLSKKNEPQQVEYTIEQYEAFAQEKPELRPWVEAQKAELLEKRLLSKLEQTRQEEREKILNEQKKAQAEQSVLSDQRYAEAFVVDSQGNKQWNPNSPLARGIYQYMQDPRLKNQPDAIVVAARLARADMLDQMTPQQAQKLTSLKRENTQLKQKTQVEGGGVSHQTAPVDTYQEAKLRAAKTGSRVDTQAAVAEYLRRRK